MITSFLQAIFLGAVQGLTEFLPVSSTAHMIIFEKVFGLNQETYGLSFDMFTSIGTTAALIIYFRKDLLTIFGKLRFPKKGKVFTQDEKLPWQILIVTAAVGLAGMILEKRIEAQFRSMEIIALSLVVVGFVMLKAESWSATRTHSKEPSQSIIYKIGLSQIIAFFPGVSRSGITISTGLFSRLDRRQAARYSFLLSVPISLAAILKRLVSFAGEIKHGQVGFEVFAFYVLGAITAGIVGYYVIKYFLAFVAKSSLSSFAYYRFALAALILIYLIRTTT